MFSAQRLFLLSVRLLCDFPFLFHAGISMASFWSKIHWRMAPVPDDTLTILRTMEYGLTMDDGNGVLSAMI